MKEKLSQKRILILSILILMIAFASSSFVLAQDGGEEPTRQRDIETQMDTRAVEPGGPGFVSISPHAFQPWSQTTQWAYFVDELYNPDAVGSFYYAHVSLPHNAIINKVVAYFYDT